MTLSRSITAWSLVLALTAQTAPAAVSWVVDDDAPGDPGPGSPLISDPLESGAAAHPFDRIQEAITAAATGDTVLVAPGAYRENLAIVGKAITLRSQAGPARTIIDGGQAGTVVLCHGGPVSGTVVDGFTLTRGNSFSMAGGVQCRNCSPTIRNNIITDNIGAAIGGAIGVDVFVGGAPSHPVIEHNIISHNVADGGGAGLFCYQAAADVINNTFLDNEAELDPGGGIRCFDSVMLIRGNEFADNISAVGGAISIEQESQVTILANRIHDNQTFPGSGGGGLACFTGAHGLIADNVITANTAAVGAGVYVVNAHPTFRSNTIVANHGAGVHFEQFRPGPQPSMSHSIIWNNAVQITVQKLASPSVTFCDVQGGWPGVGNFNLDPRFVDAAAGDWHLRADSPCRDAGDARFVPADGEVDVDGDCRVVSDRVDIGADEFRLAADLTCDGDVNGLDLAMLLAAWGRCPAATLLAPCAADLNHDGVVSGLDLAALLASWGAT